MGKGNHVAFQYATRLYDRMYELSKLVEPTTLAVYGWPGSDTEPVRLFIGPVQKTSASVGLSRSSHGAAMSILNGMQCVTQLKMGGPVVESVYVLNYKPNEEQYANFRQRSGAISRKVAPTRYDTFIDELERMKTRIKELENRMQELEQLNAGYNIRGSQTLS